jgi:hypothetical protein
MRKDQAAFEAEWEQAGLRLREARGPLSAGALAGVQPALARALGEAALHQVHVYYDASLEYGRSTSPDFGLFYIGAAQGQLDFVAFLRTLRSPVLVQGAGAAVPPLRSLSFELDELEGDLLAAYRPPASIDKHREFISASAALKMARELDAAGLRYGALLRYLQAAQRVAPLRLASASPPAQPAAGPLPRSLEERGTDHSLGRVFLELAEAERAKEQGAASVPPAAAASGTAAAIRGDVLPRYFAALQEAPQRAARPEPRATVTLVRWPYT